MRSLPFLMMVAILTLLRAGDGASPSSIPPLEDERDRYRAALTDWEGWWAKEVAREQKLLTMGLGSEGDVDKARSYQATVRAELALVERNPEQARSELRTLVQVREREWQRAQTVHRRGTLATKDLRAAERRLANARYRLAGVEGPHTKVAAALQEVLTACAREIKVLRANLPRGTLVDGDVERALCRESYARYRLARLEGRTDDALRELTLMVQLREKEFRRMQHLLGLQAAAPRHVDGADFFLLRAQQRLALARNDREKVLGLLDRLIAVAERLLERELSLPSPNERDVMAFRAEIAYQRWRRALAQDDLTRIEDDPLDELDL
jgi:hypothetical protein